jgi:alpha-tubulin suppressor-like RCC1 family protein
MVFSWGANNYGQLGAGSTQQHIDTPQALISIRNKLSKVLITF